MSYVIFSFEEGDYLRGEQERLLLFESRGLACQYMQENYQNPQRVYPNKRKFYTSKYYQAPFRVQKVG